MIFAQLLPVCSYKDSRPSADSSSSAISAASVFWASSASGLAIATPTSSSPSPCNSMSLVTSNLGFFKIFTLRINTSCNGKMPIVLFSIPLLMDSGMSFFTSSRSCTFDASAVMTCSIFVPFREGEAEHAGQVAVRGLDVAMCLDQGVPLADQALVLVPCQFHAVEIREAIPPLHLLNTQFHLLVRHVFCIHAEICEVQLQDATLQ